MSEHVRPRQFAERRVEVLELAALQLAAQSDYRMNPLRQRDIALEADPFAPGTHVPAVGQCRTDTDTSRDLPVIPEPIGHEARETRFLGRILGPDRSGSEGSEDDGKE